ncbi:MAG TPA: hemin uptake protein HemP [Sedimentisphaerales bacterium]|nr:hemin uptake protein HemP [Sedimentisphaerales bacterium]
MNNSEQNYYPRTMKPKPAKARAIPVINSDELFKGAREVKLLHGCEEYRLRITKNQKLILTK